MLGKKSSIAQKLIEIYIICEINEKVANNLLLQIECIKQATGWPLNTVPGIL